jgi:hypothetical protein
MNSMNERQINRIINLMQSDDSADAPKDAVRWAKNIFLTRAAAPQKSFVQKVLAVLQMDLSPNKAAFGERSTAGAQARQMLFEAGDNSLDLRIKQEIKGLRVQGQILGDGFSECLVKISGENAVFETRANQLSEFMLEEIPVGNYVLSLQNNETEVIIENLELK